jgi:uncharacterized protein YijF (DUF1287 family)
MPSLCATPASFRIGAVRPFRAHLGSLPAPDSFGAALAKAAQAQLNEFVIYNARYQTIAFPMGDVSPMFGVCTDVVIRAYREVGIDLQALVYAARRGRADPHIDHRRVDVLRRFFETSGDRLPVSDLPEDYQAGDIVTYYRPQNRTTTSHIAIVTDQIAPSGRPMIIHNRGWGPQMEDALFVDKITGHFRYSGPTIKSQPPIASPTNGRSRSDKWADAAKKAPSGLR